MRGSGTRNGIPGMVTALPAPPVTSAVAKVKSQDILAGHRPQLCWDLGVCAGQKMGTAMFPCHVFLSIPVGELFGVGICGKLQGICPIFIKTVY